MAATINTDKYDQKINMGNRIFVGYVCSLLLGMYFLIDYSLDSTSKRIALGQHAIESNHKLRMLQQLETYAFEHKRLVLDYPALNSESKKNQSLYEIRQKAFTIKVQIAKLSGIFTDEKESEFIHQIARCNLAQQYFKDFKDYDELRLLVEQIHPVKFRNSFTVFKTEITELAYLEGKQIDTALVSGNHTLKAEQRNLTILIICGVLVAIIFAYAALSLNKRSITTNKKLRMALGEKEEAQKLASDNEIYVSSLLEAAPDAIINFNQDGSIIYANQQASNMLKFEKEKILSSNVTDFMKFDVGELYAAMQQRALQQKAHKVVNLKLKNAAQQWVDTEISLSLINNSQNCFIVCIIRDITEREQARIKLKAQYQELKKVNKELDRFLYSTSHDLRSPVASIIGLINFIEEDSKEQETLMHVGMIRKRIIGMDTILRNMVHFINSKDAAVNKEQNLLSIVNKAVNESKENLQSSIPVNIQCEEDITLQVDGKKLGIVLSNLINNAIKFSSKEDSPVLISCVQQQQQVAIKITDAGDGIDPDLKPMLGTMFAKGKGLKAGAGLGLYVALEILEQLGGKIQFASSSSGTIVTLTFDQEVSKRVLAA